MAELDAFDRSLLHLAEGDLPYTDDHYAAWADALGVPRRAVIDRLAALIAAGAVRRFAALLHPDRAGYARSVMFVLDVPAERLVETAAGLAEMPEISHLYEREIPPGFPGSLFAMAHFRNAGEERSFIDRRLAALPITRITAYPTLGGHIRRSAAHFPS